MIPKIMCLNCKHYESDKKCEAFNVIPDKILFGSNDHSKPLPEQKNKLVFEQKVKGGLK